jgi:hypothetical protein
MAELDRLKEEVGHLKLWEGIGVVIVSGLTGWLFSSPESVAPPSFGLAVAGVLSVGIATLVLYRKIVGLIDRIGKLKPWKQ